MTRETPPAVEASSPRAPRQVVRAFGPLLRSAQAHPWIGAALAGLTGWATNVSVPVDQPTDYSVFVAAGEAIWRGDLASAFSDPHVQSGPLTLVSLSGIDRLGSLTGHQAVVASLAMALLASFCVTGAIRWRQVVASPELAGAGLLVAWTLAALWGPLTGSWAHPSHALVPLLWLVCVREAQAGRAAPAGLALGLGVALDPWAVLGACALLVLLPDVRALLRASAAAVAVTALVWGPFLLVGTATARMTWVARAGSLPDVLGITVVGAGYRGVQTLLVLAVGTCVVLRMRRDVDLAWLLPVVLVAVRIGTDGIYLDYYSFPVRAGLLVGVAVLTARRDRRAIAVAVAAWLTSVEWGGAATLATQLPLLAGVVLATTVMMRTGASSALDPVPPTQSAATPSDNRAIAVSARE